MLVKYIFFPLEFSLLVGNIEYLFTIKNYCKVFLEGIIKLINNVMYLFNEMVFFKIQKLMNRFLIHKNDC